MCNYFQPGHNLFSSAGRPRHNIFKLVLTKFEVNLKDGYMNTSMLNSMASLVGIGFHLGQVILILQVKMLKCLIIKFHSTISLSVFRL